MMTATREENRKALEELLAQMKADREKHAGKSPSQRQTRRYRWQHQNSNFGMGI